MFVKTTYLVLPWSQNIKPIVFAIFFLNTTRTCRINEPFPLLPSFISHLALSLTIEHTYHAMATMVISMIPSTIDGSLLVENMPYKMKCRYIMYCCLIICHLHKSLYWQPLFLLRYVLWNQLSDISNWEHLYAVLMLLPHFFICKQFL